MSIRSVKNCYFAIAEVCQYIQKSHPVNMMGLQIFIHFPCPITAVGNWFFSLLFNEEDEFNFKQKKNTEATHKELEEGLNVETQQNLPNINSEDILQYQGTAAYLIKMYMQKTEDIIIELYCYWKKKKKGTEYVHFKVNGFQLIIK